MKRSIVVFVLLTSIGMRPVYAQSDYVLPYPSYMPGHALYKISETWDVLQKYWYFGQLSGYKYEQKMTDKYIIQAKTLAEYGQYKLASEALEKSNAHFAAAFLYLYQMQGSEKFHEGLRTQFQSQADAHMSIIQSLDESVPETVTWDDERTESYEIPMDLLFKKSTVLRKYAYR